jgi:hypothetical protein
MFGRRSDGTLVRNLPKLRRFMPFVSPGRNESAFYYQHEIDVDAAFRFLEERNASRPADRQITLFHLYLRAVSLGMLENPETNRFVAGGRLYQHDNLSITFSALRELAKGSQLITVKREFPPGEPLEAMVDRVLGSLGRRRGAVGQGDRPRPLPSDAFDPPRDEAAEAGRCPRRPAEVDDRARPALHFGVRGEHGLDRDGDGAPPPVGIRNLLRLLRDGPHQNPARRIALCGLLLHLG